MASHRSPSQTATGARHLSPARDSGTSRLRTLGAGTAVVVLTLIFYAGACDNGFVWDDDAHVLRMSEFHDLRGLYRLWTEPGLVIQYYPLTFTSWWLQWQLWGSRSEGYHTVNVLFHAANAVLVWRILLALKVPAAWLAGAVFALHPVHVESVAWITEHKNTLSTFFYLLAARAGITAFALDRLDRPADLHRQRRMYGLGLAAFAAAMLSKTAICTFPAALLLVLWWKRGTIHWRAAAAVVPFLAVSVGLAAVTFAVEKGYVALNPQLEHHVDHWNFTWVERLLIAGRVTWFYTAKLLWPYPISFVYERWTIDSGAVWQYLFPVSAVLVVLALALLQRRIGRGPLTGVLFYGGTLAPVLGLIDFYWMRYAFVQDHFVYVPSIGLIALLAAGGARLVRRLAPQQPVLSTMLAGAVLIVLGLRTATETHKFRDIETLWRVTLEYNADLPMPNYNLGTLLGQSQRAPEALPFLERATRSDPNFGTGWNNLGIVYMMLGRQQEALEAYQQATLLNPKDLKAHVNAASLAEALDKLELACEHYRRALTEAADQLRGSPKTRRPASGVSALVAEIEQRLALVEKRLRLTPTAPTTP